MKITTLSPQQRQLLESQESAVLSEQQLLEIVGDKNIFIEDETLLLLLETTNLLYRAGYPLISDEEYDFTYLAELQRRHPNHPFLGQVEQEPVVGTAKTVDLPAPMLSTEKAYDFDAIKRWAKRIEKACGELGKDFSHLVFRGTPKLDGFAAYDDGLRLYTRGDGKKGTDVTRAFERGLQVAKNGERGLGPGEIVVDKHYFTDRLAKFFDNSRNFQASLIKEKPLEAPVANAVSEGAAVFFPFALLPDWQGSWSDLAGDFDGAVEYLWNLVPYDIDGVVFEIVDESVREYLGATRHHHRYQIAFKKNTEVAEVKVLQVTPQTSRSGRINPVAEVEPTRLSGALIRRVTAHHYAMVRDKGIGEGAVIKMSRSGEVIPKIEDVVQAVEQSELILPEVCPSCGAELEWEGDYLFCRNTMACPAQITNSIEHFFKVLGNVDGFGPSSVQKLHEYGLVSIPQLYKMDKAGFESAGFGPKQSENMVAQLRRSRTEQIEDWRFLAAFGVNRLGMGNCEKLLGFVAIDDIYTLTEEKIVEEIDGFQEKTARAICSGLMQVRPLFEELYGLGFTLQRTPLASQRDIADSAIAGKTIVFTGSMVTGKRGDMEKEAKALGASVGKSITGKTELLVTGQKVGASKMEKAEKLGVQILSEEDYRKLLT